MKSCRFFFISNNCLNIRASISNKFLRKRSSFASKWLNKNKPGSGAVFKNTRLFKYLTSLSLSESIKEIIKIVQYHKIKCLEQK